MLNDMIIYFKIEANDIYVAEVIGSKMSEDLFTPYAYVCI